MLVFEVQIQLQAFEVFRVAGLEPHIIDEIGEVGSDVLDEGVTALEDTAPGVSAATAVIGVGQQAENRIVLEFLVDLAKLPFTLVLSRAVGETKRIGRVIFIDGLVLHPVAK